MPIMDDFDFLTEYAKLSDEFKKEIQIYVLSSTSDSDEIRRIKKNHCVNEFLINLYH